MPWGAGQTQVRQQGVIGILIKQGKNVHSSFGIPQDTHSTPTPRQAGVHVAMQAIHRGSERLERILGTARIGGTSPEWQWVGLQVRE